MNEKKFDAKSAVKNSVMATIRDAFSDATVENGSDYGFKGATIVLKNVAVIDPKTNASYNVDVKISLATPSPKKGMTYDADKADYQAELADAAAKTDAE